MSKKLNLQEAAAAVGGTYVGAKTPKKLNLSSKDNKKLGDGITLTFEPEVDGFNDQYTLVRLSDGTKTLNANLTQNSLDLVDFDYGLNKNPEDLTAYASPRIPQNVRTKEQLANWCLIHMRRHFLRFAKTKTKATQAALHVKVNQGATMNKNDLKNVALAVGGTYVGAGEASNNLHTLAQNAIDSQIRSLCQHIKLRGCVMDVEFGEAHIDKDGSLDLEIDVELKAGFTYKGGRHPRIIIEDGASVTNGIDGKGAMLSKTPCKTEARLVALVTNGLRIIWSNCKKSK